MKYITLLILTVIFIQTSRADPDDFIITIQTDHYGESGFNQFTIPTNPSESYDYAVDCNNDGIVDATNITGDYTCEYNKIGEYKVRIIHDDNTGLGFPSIQFGNPEDRLRDSYKLISVGQWGTGIWTNMAYAFAKTTNFHDITTDSPNFSQVTDMQSMFYDSKMDNLNTTDWDVSSVTNMNSMFGVHDAINSTRQNITILPDVSLWDISSVTDISGMFLRHASNMPDLSQWNTSSVTKMNIVFPLFDFNDQINMIDISQWNTASVTSMAGLFYQATNIPDLSQWDTSSVTDMNSMFYNVNESDLNISNWNTSSVTNMDFMFFNAFNTTINVDDWDTSQVTSMEAMFWNSYGIILNANNWDTSSVMEMDFIFTAISESRLNVSNWGFSQINSMDHFFENTYNSILL